MKNVVNNLQKCTSQLQRLKGRKHVTISTFARARWSLTVSLPAASFVVVVSMETEAVTSNAMNPVGFAEMFFRLSNFSAGGFCDIEI